MLFPCDKCGCCCARLKCLHFDYETRTCLIYDTRPEICRVEGGEKHFKMTQEEWYKLNRKYCKIMQSDPNRLSHSI